MEKLLIIYFAAGCILALILEVIWPVVYPDEEIQNFHRLLAFFAWPLVLIAAIGNTVLENNKNRDEDDNDDQSNSGIQSGWGY